MVPCRAALSWYSFSASKCRSRAVRITDGGHIVGFTLLPFSFHIGPLSLQQPGSFLALLHFTLSLLLSLFVLPGHALPFLAVVQSSSVTNQQSTGSRAHTGARLPPLCALAGHGGSCRHSAHATKREQIQARCARPEGKLCRGVPTRRIT